MSKSKKSVFDMLEAVESVTNGDTAKGNVVAIGDIQPDPHQPRRHFDQEALDNLAASIAEYGLLQPIVVKHTGGLPPYMIVTGERRWRASQIAGLTEIPVTVREGDTDAVTGIVQLIENMNRQDLSDLEVAEQIQRLIDQAGGPEQFGLKSKIAASLNRKPADISRLLTMLETEWLPLVKEGIVTSADALSRLRSCPAELRDTLIEDARASGEPITSGTVRAARKAWDSPQPAATTAAAVVGTAAGQDAPPPRTDQVAQLGGDQAGTAAGELTGEAGGDQAGQPGDDETGTTAGELTGEAGGDQAGQPGDDEAGQLGGTAAAGGEVGQADGYGAGYGQARALEGEEGGDGGAAYAGVHTRSGTAVASGSGSAVRGKAVELQLTGEKIEALLRYLVDKASDRLSVKVPNDLAVAVIENLGGEVPEDPTLFATTILTLLDRKLS